MRAISALRNHARQSLDALRRSQGVRTLLDARAGGGGALILWAKITSVSSTTFVAKLVDADGNVGQNVEFTCNVLASGVSGLIVTGFTLANCAPQLSVDAIVPVMVMPAAGATRPAGYWLAWYVVDTCT